MVNDIGMDVDLVRAAAAKLDAEATALAAIIASIDGIVGRLPSVWVGRDAGEFVGWWQNQHRPALKGARDAISGLAQSARNNVVQQDTASRAVGTTTAGGIAAASLVGGVAAARAAGGAAAADGGDSWGQYFQGSGQQFADDWHAGAGGWDQWGFGYDPRGGDCTSFVAWRLNQLASAKGLDWHLTNGAITGQTAPLPQGVLGNALTWGPHAAAAGFPPNSTPAVGSVAWYAADSGGVGSSGHVGIVTAVGSNGAVTIEQSNYGGPLYDTTTTSPGAGNYPTGFIHLLPGS